ncbi:MAG: hypothetical protein AAFN74_10065 [Myxococcota bacterium]
MNFTVGYVTVRAIQSNVRFVSATMQGRLVHERRAGGCELTAQSLHPLPVLTQFYGEAGNTDCIFASPQATRYFEPDIDPRQARHDPLDADDHSHDEQ